MKLYQDSISYAFIMLTYLEIKQ